MPETPPRHRWSPPPAKPPDRRALVVALVGLAVVLVAAAVVGGTAVRDRRPGVAARPAVTSSTPTPIPTSAPSASSTPTSATTTAELPAGIPTGYPTPVTLPTPTDLTTERPTDGPTARPTGDLEKPLVANRLDDEQLAVTACAQRPRPVPTSEAAYRRYLDRMFDCLGNLYRAPLEKAGYTLTRPYLVFFSGTRATPCGTSPTELSVFYCSANETVYATRQGLDDYASMRLGLFYVVLHEYAHHVQERAGILDAARFRHEDWPQVSRRIELQAECLMGISLRTVASAGFTDADRAELHAWRERVPDSQHGTSASQLRWIDTGLATRSIGRCNTWSAPVDEVR